MRRNPYSWQNDRPLRWIARDASTGRIAEFVHRGIAVKIIGGRGMGKSVLLQQLEQHLQQTQGTRVVRLPSPPEEATVAGAVRDLAARLRIQDLAAPRMDDLLDRALQGGVEHVVALFDETDQYVTLGEGPGGTTFARNWFNKLEAIRKQYSPRFSVVFAGPNASRTTSWYSSPSVVERQTFSSGVAAREPA